jgi:hypothetical protein
MQPVRPQFDQPNRCCRPSADIDAPQLEEARRIQSLELPVPLGRVRRSVLRTIKSALEVAPIMASAGWNDPQPLVLPTGLNQRGTLVLFRNVTGLVAGETALGDELGLLHTPPVIARSALARFTGWNWNGSRFVAPA